jgi:hypothetical protein
MPVITDIQEIEMGGSQLEARPSKKIKLASPYLKNKTSHGGSHL